MLGTGYDKVDELLEHSYQRISTDEGGVRYVWSIDLAYYRGRIEGLLLGAKIAPSKDRLGSTAGP